MTLRSLSLFAPLLLVLGGCSSSDPAADGDAGTTSDASSTQDASGDSAPGDASSSDASAADTSANDSSLACNAIANIATQIPMDYVASAPPVAQGGTIVDGTYIMTAAGFYTGVGGVAGTSGITGKVTIKITGSTIEVVTTGTPPNDHLTTTIATSGTAFTRTDTCPDTMAQQGTYTATSTTFIAILPAGTFPDGGTKTLVETFTKQ